MSDLNQGQPIDPEKLMCGRRAMTQSARQQRQRGTSQIGEEEEVKRGRMVKGVLRLPRLHSHRWLTRRRWSV